MLENTSIGKIGMAATIDDIQYSYQLKWQQIFLKGLVSVTPVME